MKDEQLRMELLHSDAKTAEERMSELANGEYRRKNEITLYELHAGIKTDLGLNVHNINHSRKNRAPDEVYNYEYEHEDCTFRSYPDGIEVLANIDGSGRSALAYLVRTIGKEAITLGYGWDPSIAKEI